MRAPGSLDAASFPLSGEGVSSDLFPWARVKDDRNVHGPLSIAVPGTVDGMRVAHERFAKLPWKKLVEPAIALAEQGLLIDWFATESIASAAADLNRYPASRAAYLVDGASITGVVGAHRSPLAAAEARENAASSVRGRTARLV